MKTLKKSVSAILKPLLLLCVILNMSSCSSDDDSNGDTDDEGSLVAGVSLPSDRLGPYLGVLTYVPTTGTRITTVTGTANISGASDGYTINFSDNVPSLEGIIFNLINGEYIYVNPKNTSETVIIETTGDKRLVIGLTVNDGVTTFAVQ